MDNYSKVGMRGINMDIARRLLELLVDAQGTNVDHVRLWADTYHEMAVQYNPYMHHFEFVDISNGSMDTEVDLDVAAAYIVNKDVEFHIN